MTHGARESKILGGGGCFVRFLFSMSPSCIVLVMYALVLDGFRLFASGC